MKKLGESKTIKDAARHIESMRKYRPFEWSGKHYVIQKDIESFVSYRSKASAKKNASAAFPYLWEIS